MYKPVLILALAGTVAACATTEPRTAQRQNCVEQSEEATGSRVQTATICSPAEPTNGGN